MCVCVQSFTMAFSDSQRKDHTYCASFSAHEALCLLLVENKFVCVCGAHCLASLALILLLLLLLVSYVDAAVNVTS